MKEEERIVKIAVIGTGKRSLGVIKNLLDVARGRLEIAAACDISKGRLDEALGFWQVPDAPRFADAGQAIDAPGVEWVLIFTPNACHREHILSAFAAGKHVFCEKPLATGIKDCLEIFNAHKQSGVVFSTGFVLRYSPLYRKVKELIDSGRFGKLISINADENIPPAHGGFIMCNWRRLTRNAGPHLLEKCCHDLDLINWFCDSLPSRVASFGGLNIFTPEHADIVDRHGMERFKTWKDYDPEPNPFLSGKDIMDNQVCIAEYRNRVRVVFQATMSNVLPERRMYFSLTEGTIIAEIYSRKLTCRSMSDQVTTTQDFGEVGMTKGGHGGGDEILKQELFDCIYHGSQPKCSGREGLESAIFAMALHEAALKGEVFDLEPIWKQLNR